MSAEAGEAGRTGQFIDGTERISVTADNVLVLIGKDIPADNTIFIFGFGRTF